MSVISVKLIMGHSGTYIISAMVQLRKVAVTNNKTGTGTSCKVLVGNFGIYNYSIDEVRVPLYEILG